MTQPTILIVPNFHIARDWCREHNIRMDDPTLVILNCSYRDQHLKIAGLKLTSRSKVIDMTTDHSLEGKQTDEWLRIRSKLRLKGYK